LATNNEEVKKNQIATNAMKETLKNKPKENKIEKFFLIKEVNDILEKIPENKKENFKKISLIFWNFLIKILT